MCLKLSYLHGGLTLGLLILLTKLMLGPSTILAQDPLTSPATAGDIEQSARSPISMTLPATTSRQGEPLRRWFRATPFRQAQGTARQASQPFTVTLLALPVEFSGTDRLFIQRPADDFSDCVDSVETFSGPLRGQIPYPGGGPMTTIDNFTPYYDPATSRERYQAMLFAPQGLTVPVRAGDPNINNGAGAVLSHTVAGYFAAQSDDTVVMTGTVAPWVALNHAQAYYGLDACTPGSEPPATADIHPGLPTPGLFVIETAEALKSLGGDYATYDFWQRFDTDDDNLIDMMFVIHAGRGQEAGGGSEALYSGFDSLQFTDIYSTGYVIHDNDTPANPADDIKIQDFFIYPENVSNAQVIADVNFFLFNLQPLITTDTPDQANSIGWWDPMAAGIDGGQLKGSRPVNLSLYQRLIADCGGTPCGWANPVKEIEYQNGVQTVVIGQAGTPAGGTVSGGPYEGQTIYEGMRIKLADQRVRLSNRAGSGGGAYSNAGNDLDHTLDRSVDLTGVSGQIIMAVDTFWDIETDWDYGYVELSTDGLNFISIPDIDGLLTTANPFGQNLGYGLTGAGMRQLRFDLSAYAGQPITIRFRYVTDAFVSQPGWWLDNLVVTGPAGQTLLADDFGEGSTPETCTTDDWTIIPCWQNYPHYYLVEWRNDNGFDQSLADSPYNISYQDEDETRVDRVPGNVPGAVIMYRNSRYEFSDLLQPQLFDTPSMGAKYALLMVDTNYWPVVRPSGEPFNAHLASINGALALQDQPDYTLEIRNRDTITLTEQFIGRPGVRQFDDALTYFPGGLLEFEGLNLNWWRLESSVVLPAREGKLYSTQVTYPYLNPDQSPPPRPLYALYGEPVEIEEDVSFLLGTGNPGDVAAQYGLQIELLDQAPDGSWGAVQVTISQIDYTLTPSTVRSSPGDRLTYTLSITNWSPEPATVEVDVTLPTAVTLLTGQLQSSESLAAGQSISRTLVTQIDDAILPVTDLSATATFNTSFANRPPVTSQRRAAAVSRSKLALDLTANRSVVAPNDILTYTLTAENRDQISVTVAFTSTLSLAFLEPITNFTTASGDAFIFPDDDLASGTVILPPDGSITATLVSRVLSDTLTGDDLSVATAAIALFENGEVEIDTPSVIVVVGPTAQTYLPLIVK